MSRAREAIRRSAETRGATVRLDGVTAEETAELEDEASAGLRVGGGVEYRGAGWDGRRWVVLALPAPPSR